MSRSATWSEAPTEPGIYLGLPHPLYLQIEALGSKDHRDLFIDPASWWWMSKHNPLRPADEDTDARRFGGAGHAGLLEGTRIYSDLFWLHPEQADHPGLLESTDDLQRWCRDHGLKVGGNKATLIERIRSHEAQCAASLGPAADDPVPIWNEILADFHQRRGRRGWVTRQEDNRIRLMRRVLEAMPDLRRNLQAGLSEVSVVWEDDVSGALCRTRYDRLTARAIIELKIFARREDMRLRESALFSARRLRQHMQASLHVEAFDRAVGFAAEGKVYGGTARQRRTFDKIVQGRPDFEWLFFPSNGTPTPEVVPLLRSSLVMAEGERNNLEARMNYRAWHETYGLKRMWISAARPKPLDDDTEGFAFWSMT